MPFYPPERTSWQMDYEKLRELQETARKLGFGIRSVKVHEQYRDLPTVEIEFLFDSRLWQ